MNPSASTEQVLAIVDALVVGHPDLYLTNLEFHSAVDQLARFLPPMIDGLAASCIELAAERGQFVERLIAGLEADLPPGTKFSVDVTPIDHRAAFRVVPGGDQ